MNDKDRMSTHASGLTDIEFSDFNDIIGKTIQSLIDCADKHNIDRDSFIKYFATMFSAMAAISTFSQYGKEKMGDINENKTF